MNILIVSAVFYPEPIVIGTLSRDIALKLSEEHNVTVICPRPTRPYGYDFERTTTEDSTYERIVLKNYTCAKTSYIGRLLETVSFGRAVSRFIKDNHSKFDVIYSWSWPLYSQYLIAKTANKKHLPIVTHVQDVYPEPFLRRLKLGGTALYKLFFGVDKRSLQLSTKVIAIAPQIKEYLVKTRDLNGNNVEVVYNWQDESRFEKVVAKSSERDKPFTFMFLGTLSGAANLKYIAESFLAADISNSRFVFAGTGSAKAELEVLASKDSKQRIQFCNAPFKDVAEIQAQADVLIVSLNKGGGAHAFPSKLPAYMFSKKPVLASVDLDSDIAHTVRQANCGWIVVPNQQNQLSQKLLDITKLNKQELILLGNNGFEYSQKFLSKEINLNKICKTIEMLKDEK